MGGDGGAWVIDHQTGRVCGVALAWNVRQEGCYIVSLEIILEDIKKTLDAKDVCISDKERVKEYYRKQERYPRDGV